MLMYFTVITCSHRKIMVYIPNLVQAIAFLRGAPPRQPAGEDEVYNYADKPDLASKDVIAQVYGALGRRAPRMHLPLPPIMSLEARSGDRKSTRLNSSHVSTSYAVFCLKKHDMP